MKTAKTIMMVLAVSLFTINASAQRGLSPKRTAKKQTKFIKKNIPGLSKAQLMKISSMNLRHAKSARAARKGKNRNQMMAVNKRLNAEHRNNLKAIFTPVQYQKYLRLVAKKKSQRGNRNGKGHNGNRRVRG